MPTPVGDCITATLQNSLSGKKRAREDDDDYDLDNLLNVGSKQALFTKVEYELAENQFANSLSAMKSKYTCFSPKHIPKKNGLVLGNNNLHKGNGLKNGCTNGVKNGNGVKVNPDAVLPQPKFIMFPPENVVLGWKSKGPVGAGMQNMGNTCYLNSILQALFHVPAVVNFLMGDTEHRKKCEQENGPSFGDCLTCALAKTLHLSKNQNVIRPELITSKLRMICRSLNYGAEEDAHEFMRYLLENVERGYLKRFPQKKLDPYSRETTPINQIFGGYIRQEVTCRNCENVSTTFQHFQDLLLDIRKVSKVEDALDQYFSKEILDGSEAYRCEKCKQQSQATKKYSIEKPPKVLCMQLKRFTGSGSKIQKIIELKLNINLKKYMHAASQYSSSTRYKLIAMVTHSGMSAGGGHYTAIAETPSQNYYLFDDSCVTPIASSSMTNTGAYILFFEMILDSCAMNGQREYQSVNKTTTSTVTSNGSSSSNGSTFSSMVPKKWDAVPSHAQASAPTQAASPTPRLIFNSNNRKSKSPLADKGNRPDADHVRSETKPGFIGPRLPSALPVDAKGRVHEPPSPPPPPKPQPLTNDDPPKRPDAPKTADDKKKAKPVLVPYPCEDDSTSSESSTSPDSNHVKSTTPNGWQVRTVSSPSSSGEGSARPKWNVTTRHSPIHRKVNNCSSDPESDTKNSESLPSSTAGFDRTVGDRAIEAPPGEAPPSPASILRTGAKDFYFKKRNENETERMQKEHRPSWGDKGYGSHPNKNRPSYRNEEGGDSHLSRKSDGSASYNGGPNRNFQPNRNNSMNGGTSNGMGGERSNHNGHSQSKPYRDASPNVVSSLHKLSHTGLGDNVVSWHNEKSVLDRSMEEERRYARKRESDYDEEMDRGRIKKMRRQKDFNPGVNPFNNYQYNRQPHNHFHKDRNHFKYYRKPHFVSNPIHRRHNKRPPHKKW